MFAKGHLICFSTLIDIYKVKHGFSDWFVPNKGANVYLVNFIIVCVNEMEIVLNE